MRFGDSSRGSRSRGSLTNRATVTKQRALNSMHSSGRHPETRRPSSFFLLVTPRRRRLAQNFDALGIHLKGDATLQQMDR